MYIHRRELTQLMVHDAMKRLSYSLADEETRADVQSTIRFTLNGLPEEPYPEAMWQTKVGAVWAYISCAQQRRSGAELH